MKKRLYLFALQMARLGGLFALSRRLTQRALRILCYHGGSIYDEHAFSPGTFMTREMFEKRMDFLVHNDYPVLGLEDAIERLCEGALPPCATVITIDDGWYGTFSMLYPVLHCRRLPATLYVTTYYVEQRTPVFNMLVSYLLWSGDNKLLHLNDLDSRLTGSYCLGNATERNQARKIIVDFGDLVLSADGRQRLASRLASLLGIDHSRLNRMRLFRLVEGGEIASMSKNGIDIQLHTHRHRLPEEREAMRMELEENAKVLSRYRSGMPRHLCYPSGDYNAKHLDWLAEMGILTATTTKPGFNYPNTPRLELRRFLDRQTISHIEFEAELCGFLELVRRLTGVRI